MTKDKIGSKSSERFAVLYRISVRDRRNIEEHATDIALEQTVEIPWDCVPDSHHKQGIVGCVEKIEKVAEAEQVYDVSISYRCDITGFTIPQFLNVLFGNISLKNNVKIIDISIPKTLRDFFSGPAFGIAGVRAILGVNGRPLSCTALKPMGSTVEELAELASVCALGGIDIIKDDHGISDQHFHPFKERVQRCQEAVEKANAATHGKTLYFPMVNGRFDEIEEQAYFARQQGVLGILIAPFLVGPDTVRFLAKRYGLIIMTHPALTGTFFHDDRHGITPAMLLGKVFRLIGSDILIFPNAGGRFCFTKKECIDLVHALRGPEGAWKPAFPCPAGGMGLDKVKAIIKDYGEDTILLIGGALKQHSKDIIKGAQAFMNEIFACSPQKTSTIGTPFTSSCEFVSGPARESMQEFLPQKEYRWSGRTVQEYKKEDVIDFKDITRQELIGTSGEKTSFDLRYFEILPDGFSSFERHVHEHVIIGVRGRGVVIAGEKRIELGAHDIAYVASLAAHQVRNESTEPFGFFCIVDHKRDKPVKV